MKRITQTCWLALLLSAGADAAELNADERRMVEWIDANIGDAIDLVEETVNISSGTMNHDGIRELGAVMRRELDAIGSKPNG